MARRTRAGAGKVVVSLLILLGGLLLLLGWGVSGYLSDVMLNIGTALLLFAPLLYLQRLVEQQLAQVREETRSSVDDLSSELAEVRRQASETAARLDQLGEATKTRIKQQQDMDARAFAEFEKEPSRQVLIRLLSRADQLNAIAPGGVRVQIPGVWERLRFATGEAHHLDGTPAGRNEEDGFDEGDRHLELWVTVESAYGEAHKVVSWLPGEQADEFMSKVATELQSMGLYRDSTFDAGHILRSLENILRIAIEGRTGVGDYDDLDPIIEIPNDQWIIQTTGMSSPGHGYFISAREIAEVGSKFQPEDQTLYARMREKAWVDSDKFDMAVKIAQGLYAIGKRRDEPPF